MRDIHGKEDEKNVWYYYENFEKAKTENLSVSKRKLFVIIRLRYNRFEFLVECVISCNVMQFDSVWFCLQNTNRIPDRTAEFCLKKGPKTSEPIANFADLILFSLVYDFLLVRFDFEYPYYDH